MYCSTCGVGVAQGLSYCKHCGAKVNPSDSVIKSSQLKPETLIQAMTAVFVLGFISIIMLMGVLKVIVGLPVDQVLAVALLPFLLMLVLEGVFMRLLFRSTRETKRNSNAQLSSAQATNELDAAQARVLPEPVPSVTEHTTRAFDPIYNDRK